jgi:hypothetical protein
MTMTERERGEAGGDEGRVTRRAAIATGAAAYGGSMLWGTAAFAAQTPRQLLEDLRREIRNSKVHKQLKSRLLALTGDVKTDLESGSNVRARKALRHQVIPLLQKSSGHHGLSPQRSKEWVAETRKIASKIPRDDGLEPNGPSVYVFNCYNEPISGFTVGGSQVGDIPGSSSGSGQAARYTPAGLPVPRSRHPDPGSFAIGNNQVSSPWDSFLGTATITIPDPSSSGISLDDDLILFLALNQAMLLTTRGFVKATFQVTLQ